MRATSIALCSLTALATGEFHQAAQATPEVSTVPATIPDPAAVEAAQPITAIALPETITPAFASTAAIAVEPITAPSDTRSSGEEPANPGMAEPVDDVAPAPPQPEAVPLTRVIASEPAIEPGDVSPQNPPILTQTVEAPKADIPEASQSDSIPPTAISQSAIDLLAPQPSLAQAPPTDGLPDFTLPESEPPPDPLNPEDTKEELGEVRILRRPTQQPPPRRQPDVQLFLRSAVFSSSNITALSFFQPSDTVFTNSAILLATPKLGPTTRLIASAEGGLVRFATEHDFDYNYLDFNVAIQQRIAPGMYAQLGWVNDQLYRADDGDRLLSSNAVDFTLGRQDQLMKRLRLDSFYNLRASFTDPDDQNRLTNTLGTRLRYDFSPNFQGSLDYRLTFKDYTEADRFDTEHQVSAIATYAINPNLFVAGSVSYLFGRSSDPDVDLSNLSFGISLGWSIPLF